MAEQTENKTVEPRKKMKTKKKTGMKKGVVYLSCIPRGMPLKRLREEMEKFGEVGNVFLEPDDKPSHNPYQQTYKEGWVEFLDKAVAKQAAGMLNNNQVGGRKKNPWREDLWNVKYLPKFQWAHLNARLAYEKGISKQRLRADISQIKREAQLHKKNFMVSKIKKKEEKKEGEGGGEEEEKGKEFRIRQRETEEEVLTKKRKREEGEKEEGPSKKRRRRPQRQKKSEHRPDADHPVGALSLGASQKLLQTLFGGKS